jgi:hypothetical protein
MPGSGMLFEPGLPAGPVRVLVTASRYFGPYEVVRGELAAVAAQYGRPVQVVHGQCDPRDPDDPRKVIEWYDAEKLPLEQQKRLLGGDWLADVAAFELDWPEPERHPADWHSYPRQGGFIRSAAMVKAGAVLCLAFTGPCADRRCGEPRPHESHGTTYCADRARRAGIPVRPVPLEG